MKVSVIITTYNHPAWLERVIWGYEIQTYRHFELVIADDGSDERTHETIDRLRARCSLTIHHIWQEDRGFRKCQILNQAIRKASCPYLLFTDGDCLPRQDFLAKHVALAEPGRFLSGGVVRLPKQLSQQINQESIQTGDAFDGNWLRHRGLGWNRKLLRLTRNERIARYMDQITPTRPTFNGHNVSTWRADVVKINGFNEEMKYGGLDRELGERLVNSGIYGKQIRHRAVAVHLYHRRDYATRESWKTNNAIRARTQRCQLKWTEQGLNPTDPQIVPSSQGIDRSTATQPMQNLGQPPQTRPRHPPMSA
ncbi:MAG: glycosyltransferase [Planctomycetaceae bacterium]|nr:glycosyltransferase [Planctomycetaceae bacterium]